MLKSYVLFARRFGNLLVAAFGVLGGHVWAGQSTGAGSTFFAPIVVNWAKTYKTATGSDVNYQGVGSSAGVKQLKAKSVNFGATDMPLKADELGAAGLTQFPIVIGGVVPVLNVTGIASGQLKLSGQVLGDIFMGKIVAWNDPGIASLNPGLKLPADHITVVYRTDGSGSTFLFANYLSKVNADFKTKFAVGTSVKWPVGTGAKGNDGVASKVQASPGSIGYVAHTYVSQFKLAVAQLKNPDGQWVLPDAGAFKAASANANWAGTPGMGVDLTNRPGKASWPITGATFILMQSVQSDAAKGKDVLKFFDWAYSQGAKSASDLGYYPIPADLSKLVEDGWKSQIKDSGGKALW